VSYLDLLEKELTRFRIELPSTRKLALAAYCDEVSRWNEKINLTGLSGIALVTRLVAEPVWIAQALELDGSLLDIGSGNGSPAIPFQLVSSFRSCDLVEARAKRAVFLRHLAITLKLENLRVHQARFEEAASGLNSPDWISLQAVGLTQKLIESIRLIANPTTRIVWITSDRTVAPQLPLRASIIVPNTTTRAMVFGLDLT